MQVSPAREMSLSQICSILCYLLIQTNWDTIEIECEYMWGLLPPTSLAKEGGHYLSLLSCSVHMIKNMFKHKQEEEEATGITASLSSSSILHVSVPDEETNTLAQWSIPTRPGMVVRDTTRCLQASLQCHGDWALFSYNRGEGEHLLGDEVKIDSLLADQGNSSTMLVFKRRDMNILLP